jgi:hypothetical protein
MPRIRTRSNDVYGPKPNSPSRKRPAPQNRMLSQSAFPKRRLPSSFPVPSARVEVLVPA